MGVNRGAECESRSDSPTLPRGVALFLLDQPNVAEADRVAVVLQIDRARLNTFLKRGGSRRFRKLDVVVNFHSVVQHGYPSVRGLLASRIKLCGGVFDVIRLPCSGGRHMLVSGLLIV